MQYIHFLLSILSIIVGLQYESLHAGEVPGGDQEQRHQDMPWVQCLAGCSTCPVMHMSARQVLPALLHISLFSSRPELGSNSTRHHDAGWKYNFLSEGSYIWSLETLACRLSALVRPPPPFVPSPPPLHAFAAALAHQSRRPPSDDPLQETPPTPFRTSRRSRPGSDAIPLQKPHATADPSPEKSRLLRWAIERGSKGVTFTCGRKGPLHRRREPCAGGAL